MNKLRFNIYGSNDWFKKIHSLKLENPLFRTAFKTLKAADLGQDFIEKIKKIIGYNLGLFIHKMRSGEYLYLYQVIAAYFIEPPKKIDVNIIWIIFPRCD